MEKMCKDDKRENPLHNYRILLEFTLFNFRFIETLINDIIFIFVGGHHISYHQFDHMWVDATKVSFSHFHPRYIWETTRQYVPSDLLNLSNVNSTYSDRCATTHSLHSNNIQGADCSGTHYALCQLRKQ